MNRKFNYFCLAAAVALCIASAGCSDSNNNTVASNTSNASTSGDSSSDGSDGGDSSDSDSDSGSTEGGGGSTLDLADARYIVLNSSNTEDTSASVTIDGEEVPEYDYTWKVDLTTAHDDVEDSPAEYFEGTEPGDEDVYIAHDIVYLPDTLKDQFTGSAQNDEDTEIACYYDDDVIAEYIDALFENEDYSLESASNFIFCTLPGTQYKDTMLHSEEDAYDNPVLHINSPGTYVISGEWNGQIWIDGNGDDEDSENVVNIVLNGVDVTCDVAPALVFHDVYECGPDDNTDYDVDISDAGARVYIADDTTNTFTGANVYRMLKVLPKYKASADSPTTVIDGSDVSQQKKRWKMDAAFYSFVSMLIDGTVVDATEEDTEVKGNGVLNIVSTTYEGLDTELHMTMNGGVVNVTSADDGINVNEDGISVFTLNNGSLNVTSAGGDGIDSNGWIVINDGSGTIQSGGGADHGMDADNGVYILGGSVNADSVCNIQVNNGSGTIGTSDNGGMPSGEMPSGGMPSGEMPSGEMPSGEAPSGDVPELP